MNEPLAFEAFRNHLAEQLEVHLGDMGPQHRLADDAELDSVQRLEALVAIEDLGVELPYDSVEPQQTLGGLHGRYTQALLTSSES
ncbi:acyl carrier protein [Haloactinomyces albus]|uniref:Acyl carrier protein n=1 Tax=Haloactinomyces albus TaxID=1352928 RepID=A0AAE3Z9R9_9ACTN|nr:acyl carrier protein [Haloactinomyces albus]MDR7299900.1 acyl carrier protein [Haloactinomyces albus]